MGARLNAVDGCRWFWDTGAASKEVGLGGLEDHAAKSRNLCSVRLFLCLDSVLWRPRQESRKARRLSAPRGHLSANPAVGCHHILADAGNPRLTKLGAVAMTATALVPVEFHGATLYAITVDGVHHVALRPICDALGIDWEAQRLRIRRHPVLNETACVTKAVAADGKEREVVALPLDKLNGWLFGVSVNRVKPELREKLISYQRECFEVLARHFMPAQRPHNPAIDYDRISPAQAQDLKELVHAIVDTKVQTFAETWARLHKKFKVNSYLELPAARFEEAREYLQGKMPPPTSYLRATVKKVGRYENGDWGLYVSSGECGFGVQVGKKAMRAGGVKPGDLIRLEYLKKDNPLCGPFTRVILWDEYKAPAQVGSLLPEAQAKEITERLDRLGKLFHPFSDQFNDVMGVLRALHGMHPAAGMPEPGYRQLLPRLA